ncbi:topoisomerase C-terminal repeat-containing protein, partial [Bacillus cereus]|uniref:topoisomerase C-terminal repeat-containing protein n=1 Tax=Bacillus cereus TaxID=1396 RepID=UPI003D6511B8
EVTFQTSLFQRTRNYSSYSELLKLQPYFVSRLMFFQTLQQNPKWEVYLKGIGEGKKKDKPFVETSKKLAQKLINEAKDQVNSWAINDFVEECPSCGKPVVDKKTIYGCSGYAKDSLKSCKFSVSKEFLGQKISESNMIKLLEGKKTTLLKGLKGKLEKEFDAYLQLDEDKIQFVFPKKKKVAQT